MTTAPALTFGERTQELDRQREANAARAAEVRQLLPADLWCAWEYLARDGHLKPVRGLAAQRVYDWIVRNAAGWHRWDSRPATHLEIAEDMGITRGSVVRAVRRLEELGLIHVEHLGGIGSREGSVFTLLLPEAAKRPRRRPKPAEGQVRIDTSPDWLKASIERAGEETGANLSRATQFALEQQSTERLTDKEMEAWILAAAKQTGKERDNPVAYFRQTLRGMLQERHDERVPAAEDKRARAAKRFRSILPAELREGEDE